MYWNTCCCWCAALCAPLITGPYLQGYEAVAASNSLAFDEFEARDAEETYRLKAETARMYEMRFETEPSASPPPSPPSPFK